jgi:Leucine-rich repeat (LRR) protein
MKKSLLLTLCVSTLLIAGCSISSIQQQPGNSQTADTSQNIPSNKILDLSNQRLTKAPDNIFNRTNLEELNLSHNNLTGALQSQVWQLRNLKVLNHSDNQMTGVPAEVGQLQKLEILDLSNNQLTGLPNELGNLNNLKTLNISGNNYSTHDLDIITSALPSSVKIIK